MSLAKPIVPSQFLSSRPFPIVEAEHAQEQGGEFWGQLRRESYIALDYFEEESLLVIALKRKAAHHHFVEYNAQGPHVGWLTKVPLTLDYFRGDVVWRPTEVVEHEGLPGQLATKSVVYELYLPFLVNEDVLQFEVAMHNLQCVKVLQYLSNLLSNRLGCRLSHLSPLRLEPIGQGPIFTELSNDIDGVLCLNSLLVSGDAWMLY